MRDGNRVGFPEVTIKPLKQIEDMAEGTRCITGHLRGGLGVFLGPVPPVFTCGSHSVEGGCPGAAAVGRSDRTFFCKFLERGDRVQQDLAQDLGLPRMLGSLWLVRHPASSPRFWKAHHGVCTLGRTDPHDHTGVSHSGSIVASPEQGVLAPVFKRYKADTPLDIREHMGDL